LGFNRKGDRLVTVTDASEARVFDATSDSEDRVPLFGPVPAYGYNMSPGELVPPVFVDDAGGLLTVTAPGEITWWNTGARAIARRWQESGAILRFVVGPMGRTFTVCGYRFARIYDVATRKAIGTRMEHRNYVYSAAYRPDEEAIVTVSSDRIARLWSVPDGEPLSHPILHQREALRAAFAPDRLHFATAAEDGLVRIWSTRSDFQDERVIPLPKVEGMLRLSPDGRYVMPQGWNASRRMHDVQIFDIGSTQAAAPPLVHQSVVNAAAFTPNGQRVLTLSSLPEFAEQSRPNSVQLASQPGLVQLWDWRAAMPIGPPLATPSEPMGVDVSPDGTRAAIACAGGQVLLIDPRDMTVIRTASHGAAISIGYLIVKFVQFSPDGKTFATWGMGNDTCLWNSDSGTLRYRFTHKNWCHDALFAHDSKTLFTASADASVGIWSVETGKIAAPPLAHSDWVFRMALSHDGDSLLTASREGMAMLWDWRQGTQRCPPLENSDEVFGVAFSRDGRWIFTSAKDGIVQIWDRATGKPFGPPWVVPKQAYDIALTPGDGLLIVSGDFGSVRVFPLADYVSGPSNSLPSTTFLTWGELLSSQTVHGGRGIVNLTTDEWLDRWKRFPHKPQSAP
jgi:WD40 repeat protein